MRISWNLARAVWWSFAWRSLLLSVAGSVIAVAMGYLIGFVLHDATVGYSIMKYGAYGLALMGSCFALKKSLETNFKALKAALQAAGT